MEILDVQEYDNDVYYTKKIKMSDNVQVDSFINIIKSFENDEVKMSFCHCETFDNNGYSVVHRYYNVDDIKQISEGLSPYVSFTAEFCHRDNLNYCFSLLTNTNSNVVSYVINKKKISANMTKSSVRR